MINIAEAKVIGTLVEFSPEASHAVVETNISGEIARHLVVINNYQDPEYGPMAGIGALVCASGSISVSSDGLLKIAVEPFVGCFNILAPAPAPENKKIEEVSENPVSGISKPDSEPAPVTAAKVETLPSMTKSAAPQPGFGMPSFNSTPTASKSTPSPAPQAAPAPEQKTVAEPVTAKPASPAPASAPSFAMGFTPPPVGRPTPAAAPKKATSGGLKDLQGSGRSGGGSPELAQGPDSGARQNEPMGPDKLDSAIPF